MDDCDSLRQIQANYKMKNLSIQQKYNDEIVKDLFESIEKDNLKKKLHKSRVLFIFDDQICNNISNIRGKLNALDELATRGRHANCSYIISSQKYKSLNNNIRCLNATNLIVFSGTASSDLEAIAEEHNSMFTKDQMMDIFRKYLDKKYSFVIIDNFRRKILDSDFEEIKIEKN